MRIAFYCSQRNIYGSIGYMLDNHRESIYRYDGSVDWQDLKEATFQGFKYGDDNPIIYTFYDRIVSVYDKADVIFYDSNFPSAGRAALKIANPNVVPFVFNSIDELEDMLKDANYL